MFFLCSFVYVVIGVILVIICMVGFVILLGRESFSWISRLSWGLGSILCLAIFLFGLAKVPYPSHYYVEVGIMKAEPYNSEIVIDYIKDGKVRGRDIYKIDQDHMIVFTQDENKIGKFRWAFGWKEYQDIQKDVETIIAEKDGLVYFVSKSTGKIKTMKKK